MRDTAHDRPQSPASGLPAAPQRLNVAQATTMTKNAHRNTAAAIATTTATTITAAYTAHHHADGMAMGRRAASSTAAAQHVVLSSSSSSSTSSPAASSEAAPPITLPAQRQLIYLESFASQQPQGLGLGSIAVSRTTPWTLQVDPVALGRRAIFRVRVRVNDVDTGLALTPQPIHPTTRSACSTPRSQRPACSWPAA
jgi:hypothetical protein